MSTNTIETKLKKLRDKYPSDQSQKQIDTDEQRLRELIVQKDFSEHELVKLIVQDARERIDAIDYLLAYDETLNEPGNAMKRYAYFRTREVWQFNLDRFGGNVDQQIKDVEEDIDEQLNRP